MTRNMIHEEKKRKRSTDKEKERNLKLNSAFDTLQRCLPPCVPKDNKLPKIKTLRLTVGYIKHLTDILSGKTVTTSYASPRPLNIDDFASSALNELQTRNSYSERINECLQEEIKEQALKQQSSSSPSSSSTSPFGSLDYKEEIRYQPVPVPQFQYATWNYEPQFQDNMKFEYSHSFS